MTSKNILNYSFKAKLPLILQDEFSECGLACLAMISSYFGFVTDLVSLRKKYPVSNMGTDLKQLMDMAADMNLAARAIKITNLRDISKVAVPSIIHWRMEHFVVLKYASKTKVVIHDPALGIRTLSIEEFSQNFSGVILELKPTKQFSTGVERQKISFKNFWGHAVGLKRSFFLLFIFSIFLQIFAIISPVYLQLVVDEVIVHHDENLVITLAIIFALVLALQISTATVREYSILKISTSLNLQMATNLFEHLIKLPFQYFERRLIGDVISRFRSMDEVREVLTKSLVAAVVDGLMAFLVLSAMFIYNAKLAFVVVSVLSIFITIRLLCQYNIQHANERRIFAKAWQDTNFIETVRSIQLIKLHQLESQRKNQWQNYLANLINADIRVSQWDIFYNSMKGTLFGLENIIVICLGAWVVMKEEISLGMFFAFLIYKDKFVTSIDSFFTQILRIKMLDIHFSRLSDIVLTPIEDRLMPFKTAQQLDSNLELQYKGNMSGQIEVRNLEFYFSPSQLIFSKVNFLVTPGETIAIIGPSGCGKTTLLKCLLGLLQPTKGEILIDGISLQNIGDYGEMVSAVMQDDQLLTGTIADNIACFSPKLIMKDVISAAKTAAIHDDIMKLPMQYSTYVGDMGNNLSGGQKQRLVLARALFRKPKILFMDEATSHLDTDVEKEVNTNICALNMTRIIIAHRKETIASADRIINFLDFGYKG